MGRGGENAVLDVLVAAGVPVPVVVLWAMPELEGHDVDRELDALEGNHLVEFPAPARVAATASAVAQVALPRSRRARLRGSLGRAARQAECFAAPFLATLLLDGSQVDPDPRVIDDLIVVAHRLHAAGSIEDEIAVLRSALAAVEDGHPASPTARATLLVRLGFALRFSGDVAAAAELSARARAVARHSDDPTALAVAALAWRPESLSLSDDPSNGASLVEDALRRIGDGERNLRARLLAALSEATVFTDLEKSRQSGAAALALARTLDDPDALTLAGYAYRVAHWHPTTQDEMLRLGTELVTVAEHGVQYPEYGSCIRLQVFLELGDWAHLDPELAAMGRRVTIAPRPYERLWHQLFETARLQSMGRWEAAAALIDDGFSIAAGPDYGSAFNLLLGQLGINAWQQGADLSGMASPGALPGGPMSRVWQAGLLAWNGAHLSRETVLHILAELLPTGVGDVRADMTYGLMLGLFALAAADADDERTAALLLPELAAHGDQWLGFGGALMVGPNQLHLGRLASVLGRHEDALGHLRRAAAQAEAGRCEPWSARIDLARAHALKALGETTMAVRAARDAVARADVLGMATVAAAATRLTHTGQPAGLTDREVEVLRLAAAGASNKEIAGTLYLSIKTVERHLQNAYRKASVRNRAEAATFVAHALG